MINVIKVCGKHELTSTFQRMLYYLRDAPTV